VITTFWRWLWRGAPHGKPGILLLWNRWLVLHAVVALGLTSLIAVSPYEFAAKALFPAASILVGMAVAWTSRAAAVLQDEKFRGRVVNKERPLEDYLYGYQLSLLIIISMVVHVALTANRGLQMPFLPPKLAENSTAFGMFFLLSASVRECWAVINFSNLLSLLNDRIR
jgi:hypothetical protein